MLRNSSERSRSRREPLDSMSGGATRGTFPCRCNYSLDKRISAFGGVKTILSSLGFVDICNRSTLLEAELGRKVDFTDRSHKSRALRAGPQVRLKSPLPIKKRLEGGVSVSTGSEGSDWSSCENSLLLSSSSSLKCSLNKQ